MIAKKLILGIIILVFIPSVYSQCIPTGPEIPDNFIDEDCDGWKEGTNWIVRSTHPRLYLAKEDYPRLREQIEREPYKSVFEKYKQYIDSHLVDIENNSTNHDYILPAALVFVFTGNESYRDAAIKILDNRARAGLELGETDYLAIDIVFEYLTPEQKTNYWVWMKNTNTFYNLEGAQYHHYNYGYHFGDHFRTPLAMALIYLGEDFYNPTDLYPELIVDIMRKCLEPDDHYWKIGQRVGGDPTYNDALPGTIGGLYDIFGYDIGGEHNNHKLNYMYSHATGIDKISNWLHLKGMGAFYQQMYVPHTVHRSWASRDLQHKMPILWDTTTHPTQPANREMAASLYNDPYMQWWVNHGLQTEVLANSNFPMKVWEWLIFYNDSLEELPPSSHPTANYFNGPGIVVMRLDWTDNATYALFLAGDHYNGGRRYEDANSFIIHRKTYLVPHNGYRAPSLHLVPQNPLDSHIVWYARETAAKNTILVFDPEESWDHPLCGSPNENLPFHSGIRLGCWENLGGQEWSSKMPGRWPEYCQEHDRDNLPWYDSMTISGTSFTTNNLSYKEQANIIKFEHREDEYTYAVGDATKAYTQKINLFQREFLYIRPDIFVIFDRVNSTNKSYKKVWVMHSVFEPFFDSETIKTHGCEWVSYNTKVTNITGTKICYSGPYAGESCDAVGGCNCMGTGSTTMYINTLLPEENIVLKRGGIQYLINDSILNINSPITETSIVQPSFPSGFSIYFSTGEPETIDQYSITITGTIYNDSHITETLPLTDRESVFAYGESTGSTRTTITDTTRNWKHDEYKNYMVKVLVNGDWVYRIIKSNDENTLYVDDLGGVPLNGWSGRFYIFKYKTTTRNLWKNIEQISTDGLDAIGVDIRIKHWMTAEDERGIVHTFHPDAEYTPTNGRWVVNIIPQEKRCLDNFLNIIYLTDPGNENIPTELIKAGKMSGAFVNNSWVVMFSTTGEEITQTQYTLNGSGPVKNLVLDLKPLTTFNIYDNGEKIYTLISSDQGTLYFSITLDSEHTITLSETEPQNCSETGGVCMDKPCDTYQNCSAQIGFCSSGYCCYGSCTTSHQLPGDLNGDGHINVQDIQRNVNVILEIENRPDIIARADVNRDGNVNILDVQRVVNAMLNA